MGFILLFTSCYFVSSNILIRLGFFIIKIKVSLNVKFLFFISKIGKSKMAFFRVFLLLKCGVLKHTFSYYSILSMISCGASDDTILKAKQVDSLREDIKELRFFSVPINT